MIFFEPKRRYWDKAEVDMPGGLAAALPLNRARTVVSGTDVTLLVLRPDGQDLRRGGGRRAAEGGRWR